MLYVIPFKFTFDLTIMKGRNQQEKTKKYNQIYGREIETEFFNYCLFFKNGII